MLLDTTTMDTPGSNIVYIWVIIFVTACVAQDYYEEHHKNLIRTHNVGHLTEIPKKFDVHGENAISAFNKYINEIQDLASRNRMSVIYRVKVDTLTKNKHKLFNKNRINKGISKKYNVPLKKKNMKLSSFEIILKKRAKDVDFKRNNLIDGTTTEQQKVMYTTRQMSGGKYKPVLNAVKTNYIKIIRPVRNKVITLES